MIVEQKNARLKRLLDKQRRALTMPKARLGELEEEYAELLSRIKSERKRLGIDEESVERYIADTAEKYSGLRRYIDTWTEWKHHLDRLYAKLRKSAQNGDVDDYEYYQKRLEVLWGQISSDSQKNPQISLLGGDYEV